MHIGSVQRSFSITYVGTYIPIVFIFILNDSEQIFKVTVYKYYMNYISDRDCMLLRLPICWHTGHTVHAAHHVGVSRLSQAITPLVLYCIVLYLFKM